MTEAVKTAADAARSAVKPVQQAAEGVVDEAVKPVAEQSTDALKAAGQRLLDVLVEGITQAATQRITALSERLVEYAEHGGGPGLMAAITGGKALAEGASPVRAALSAGMSGLKQSAKGIFGQDNSGGKTSLKVTNIVEAADVGLPLRTTYDLWSRYTDFPSFMKKVEKVDQESDEKSTWQAQIFWSRRSWEATIVEQVPDSHIIWTSKGEKGHVDGAVTFTEIGPSLTRVLVVLEYHPKGFFEQTANLWRAQGRRARLELKHFVRHATAHVLVKQDEVEGWRGEIRDGEVVRSHEDVMRAEQEPLDERDEFEEPKETADYEDNEVDEYDEDYDEHPDESESEEDTYEDEESAEEEEPEPVGASRSPHGQGRGRGSSR